MRGGFRFHSIAFTFSEGRLVEDEVGGSLGVQLGRGCRPSLELLPPEKVH
jgi:hypothetical protein